MGATAVRKAQGDAKAAPRHPTSTKEKEKQNKTKQNKKKHTKREYPQADFSSEFQRVPSQGGNVVTEAVDHRLRHGRSKAGASGKRASVKASQAVAVK